MNTKAKVLIERIHPILPYLVITTFAVLIVLFAQPWWDAPDIGFDAISYLQMAQDPVAARDNVPSHHYERILPSILIFGLHRLSGIPHPELFRAVAVISFLGLASITYWALAHFSGAKWLSISMTITMMLFPWQVVYNVSNFYQLVDLWTYVLGTLILIGIVRRNFWLFAITGLLAIPTRQNLIILVFFGFIYFFEFKKFFSRQNCVVALAGMIQATLVIWLLWFSTPTVSSTFRHVHFENMRNTDWRIYTDILRYLAPFVVVSFICFKTGVRRAVKYYPISIFVLATVLQPYTVFDITGVDSLRRLIMPGLWLMQLSAASEVLRTLQRRRDDHLSRVAVAAMPLVVGTAHIATLHTLLLRPLFVLPSSFRFIAEVIFGGVMLRGVVVDRLASTPRGVSKDVS